jgi:leucyl aminopeptidase
MNMPASFPTTDQLVRVQAAGVTTGERVWQLPLDPFYDKMIRSKIADMKNIGGGNSAPSPPPSSCCAL